MSQTIKKITDLVNAESFLQVNLYKGYKYVDKAGEIVNYFYKGSEVPKFTMDLNGLTIINPDDKVETLKISANVLWAHFPLPDSLEIMDNYLDKKAEDLVKIIDVEEVLRIGWRSYFVYEFKTESTRDEILEKFAPIDGLTFEGLAVATMLKEKNLTIRIRKVKKNDEGEAPGIMFDVDLYENFDKVHLVTDKISSKLKEFKDVMRSEDFIGLLNKFLVVKK